MADIEIPKEPVENTPTQTLLRFVSLRSPQLPEDEGKDKTFIHIPEKLKNDEVFYKPVVAGSGSKQKLLMGRASIFENSSDCIKYVDTLKNTYEGLCSFGIWLAINKTVCNYEEYKDAKNTLLGASPILPESVSLWNNLIYQVVTQKDFYIKEMLMQILLALHMLPIAKEEEVQTALAARVVLPPELMLDDKKPTPAQVMSKSERSYLVYPDEDMKMQQLVSSAKIKLNRIASLERNLSTTEKEYNKEYQEEYQAQYGDYQKKIEPIMDRYHEEVAAARQEFCELRPPEQEYNPEDPCSHPKEVPFPKLPPFDFSFREEVNAEYLTSSLKEENIDTLLEVLGHRFDEEMPKQKSAKENTTALQEVLDGRNTFAELISAINENVEDLNTQIVQNVTNDEKVYTSVGGVMVPVARTVVTPFTYTLCPRLVYKLYMLDFSIAVPDASWDIMHLSYALTPNGSAISIDRTNFVKSRTGNTIFLNNLFDPGLEFSTIQDSSLKVKIIFSNYRIAEFSIYAITSRVCVTGRFTLEIEEGEETPEYKEEDSFIPSGFGFKNIGIADYLKVEQSTHAYVEGEVAHIENIMAREYREKSTRRLRRAENTTTTSSETEKEKLTDTTTANRYEMQSEIAKMMQESSDFGGFANASFSFGKATMSLGANYAHHRSKEESTRQAVTQSQEITARAMDRIVNKIREERIEKIIEEFEENNSHGFDNRKGNHHVVGVYRWVDKLMKNQIYNYGKRMMFEFMVPEPAKLHMLGMKDSNHVDQINLAEPVDPRTAKEFQMKDYSSLADEKVLKFWTAKYNVELEEKPGEVYYVSKSFSDRDPLFAGSDNQKIQIVSGAGELEIPTGYEVQEVDYRFTTYPHGFGGFHQAFMTIAGHSAGWIDTTNNTQAGGTLKNLSIREKLAYSFSTAESPIISGSINAKCILTPELRIAWQQKTFKAIIDAYEEALAKYKNAIAEENSKAVTIKDSNPAFYRQIENTILRKNCISYMADRATDATHGYGLSGLTQGNSFKEYETVLSYKLDQYTAFVKFMEQAFEWETLSYYLYPYYWGNRQNWVDLYQSENTDPLFRAFMQSGMARVVVTVRPGFEDTVQFYLATGKIWNGGEVPVIGDKFYLSIVEEMKQPKGKKEGKAWLTRLPTTLTILQAESIGLEVAHALPFTTENPDDFEVPSEVITQDRFNFEKNDYQLGVDQDEEEKIISGDWL